MFNNIKVSMNKPKYTGFRLLTILDGDGGDYPDEMFDPIQLARGIEIEMEHTSFIIAAKIIAKQHLTEYPEYYVYLIEMEEKLKRL
jgi:hypothetical protein